MGGACDLGGGVGDLGGGAWEVGLVIWEVKLMISNGLVVGGAGDLGSSAQMETELRFNGRGYNFGGAHEIFFFLLV